MRLRRTFCDLPGEVSEDLSRVIIGQVQRAWNKTVLPDVTLGIRMPALANAVALVRQLAQTSEPLAPADFLVGEIRSVHPAAVGGPKAG